MVDVAKAIKIGRKKFIDFMAPDTCNLLPAESDDLTYVNGIPQQTDPDFREYNGSTDIPCRVDLARAFRPATLEDEISEVEEYSLELPYDLEFKSTDLVRIDEKWYHFRKVLDVSVWDMTKSGLIMRVEKVSDYHD